MAEKTINYIKLPDGETYRVGGGSGFNLFDTKVSDHVLEGEEALGWALQGTYVYKEGVAGSRTGYADFYNKCLAEKELGTATETTLGDNTITMYVNANGHKFYDIADKDIVDTWYNTYGIADYYGVDTENERIFLPRNDYFVQLTGDTNKVNEMFEAGLPNITGTLNADTASTGYSGALKQSKTGNGSNGTTGSGSDYIYFDASWSNSIYGNSDTVQPQSSLKLLYYCVGNTKVESAISNVTEITTSENDTLPLFHNFYSKEDMTTTGAYINASLGSYLSGNVYPTAYNELVNKLGTGNVKANTDTYTDYDFVVNQDDMTFRLPLKNGQEIMFATGVKGNGMTLGLTDGTNNFGLQGGAVGSAAALSTGESYYGDIVGARATQSSGQYPYTMGITTDSTKSGIILDTENITIPDGWNLYYKVANAVTNLELLDASKVMAEVNNAIKKTECPAYIVETYQNGTSWYRVYSDGWCEQGGVNTVSSTSTVVSLLKNYINNNYSVMTQGYRDTYSSSNTTNIQLISKTTSQINIACATSTTSIGWQACGYIA